MGMERISHTKPIRGWQADEMPIESYEDWKANRSKWRGATKSVFELHQMPLNDRNPDPKLITSCASHGHGAGETIQWFGSSLQATSGVLDLVNSTVVIQLAADPLLRRRVRNSPLVTIDLTTQPLVPGSTVKPW